MAARENAQVGLPEFERLNLGCLEELREGDGHPLRTALKHRRDHRRHGDPLDVAFDSNIAIADVRKHELPVRSDLAAKREREAGFNRRVLGNEPNHAIDAFRFNAGEERRGVRQLHDGILALEGRDFRGLQYVNSVVGLSDFE